MERSNGSSNNSREISKTDSTGVDILEREQITVLRSPSPKSNSMGSSSRQNSPIGRRKKVCLIGGPERVQELD